MRKPKKSKKDCATQLSTALTPWRLVSVRALNDFRLSVEFVDGLRGQVNMSAMILGENAGVFSSLKDERVFKQVYLKHGVVTWPGDIDLAPDAMYEAIKQLGEWVLT